MCPSRFLPLCVAVLGPGVTNSVGKAGLEGFAWPWREGKRVQEEKDTASTSLKSLWGCSPASCSCPGWALWCHPSPSPSLLARVPFPSPSPLPGAVRKGLLSLWGGAGGAQNSDFIPVAVTAPQPSPAQSRGDALVDHRVHTSSKSSLKGKALISVQLLDEPRARWELGFGRGCTDSAPVGEDPPTQDSHRVVGDAPSALIKGTMGGKS